MLILILFKSNFPLYKNSNNEADIYTKRINKMKKIKFFKKITTLIKIISLN